MKILLFIIFFSLTIIQGWGQCTTRGQTPGTAFPVCGTAVFQQKEVPACTNGSIYVKGCSGNDHSNYEDASPFWYKFTCFESGTLGFLIEPMNQEDDYDWQIFDITGHDPNEVYADHSLYVSANWAGVPGNTGAIAGAKQSYACASPRTASKDLPYSTMPELKKGHQYLLLVSHFSGSTQSGYKLSFKGGSAVITDTTSPRLRRASPTCDGRNLTILLNKGMRCESLAPDGSDFKLLKSSVSVHSAASTDCTDGFDMEQLVLHFDGKLQPGKYAIAIKKGSDKNTLLDNCGNAIPEGDTLHFEVQKIHPTPMDSIKKVGCTPKKIQVVFAGPMRCNSIAADGSDFNIKNSETLQPLTITGAKAVDCDSNLTRTVEIELAHPIYKKGIYELSLQEGKDGNSILSECEVASEPQSLIFETSDTVSAKIVSHFTYDCNTVNIQLSNPGQNGINEWQWDLPAGRSGNRPQVSYIDTTFSDQLVRLFVSNGVCSDEDSVSLALNQDFYIHADFQKPEFICPQDQAVFKDSSLGSNITEWKWNFGNSHTFYGEDPGPQRYPAVVRSKKFAVQLIVVNSRGCSDTSNQQIKVINTCTVHVPTAFTPNNDGQNDYLYPLNAYLAEDLLFRVYNRYGQMVFQTRDWTKKWDGTFKGQKQPEGSYIWMLQFTNSRTGQKVFRKGASLLIR